jgi:hypothetical protein
MPLPLQTAWGLVLEHRNKCIYGVDVIGEGFSPELNVSHFG